VLLSVLSIAVQRVLQLLVLRFLSTPSKDLEIWRPLADVDYVSRTTSVGGWPPEHTEWAVRSCGRSPRLRGRTPCCGGIAS
jgi:hypothetical protein